jgi:uncharacterized protein
MTRALGGLALGAAAGGVWVLAAPLPLAARLLTVFLTALLPLLMLAQGSALREQDLSQLSRGAAYLSSSISLWVLTALTLLAASAARFSPADLGLVPLGLAASAAWAMLAVFAGLAITFASRTLGVRETPMLEHLLPRTRRERAGWVGVSLTAGICEEIVFRGFLITALAMATGSLWVAAVASSAVFGTLHGYQGITGIVRTAILGLVLAVPFVVTGSIVPSIVAHIALDLVIGLYLADWLLPPREGEPAPG